MGEGVGKWRKQFKSKVFWFTLLALIWVLLFKHSWAIWGWPPAAFWQVKSAVLLLRPAVEAHGGREKSEEIWHGPLGQLSLQVEWINFLHGLSEPNLLHGLWALVFTQELQPRSWLVEVTVRQGLRSWRIGNIAQQPVGEHPDQTQPTKSKSQMGNRFWVLEFLCDIVGVALLCHPWRCWDLWTYIFFCLWDILIVKFSLFCLKIYPLVLSNKLTDLIFVFLMLLWKY